MKKKIFCIIFSVILILTTTACTNKNSSLNNDVFDDVIVDTPNDNIGNNFDTDNDNEVEVIPPIQPLPPELPEEVPPIEEVKNTDVLLKSTVNGLNVRSLPNTSSQIVGTIDKNDALAYLGESGNFYKTIYKDKEAYVHKSYITLFEFEKSDNEKIESIIEKGKTLLGFPYVYGAQRYHFGGNLNKNFVFGKFDCSSLTQYLYYFNGVNLKPTSREQSLQGETISKSNLLRGDLMYFTNATRYNYSGIDRIGHVAIYLGNNYILHTASDYAVIEEISVKRWSYFTHAKRVIF